MIKKTLSTALLAIAFPVLVCAGTYEELIQGAGQGDTPAIAALVKRGASVDTTDSEGNTLLILAAREGHGELVDFLVRNRAKLNARNAAGDTALRLAAFRGHQRVVELLLAGGAAVNMPG